jgi:hypothetical protein
MESASQLLKKLIKTTVCNAFSFHERFHIVKVFFVSRVAPIESRFRTAAQLEKSVGNSIASDDVLKCARKVRRRATGANGHEPPPTPKLVESATQILRCRIRATKKPDTRVFGLFLLLAHSVWSTEPNAMRARIR